MARPFHEALTALRLFLTFSDFLNAHTLQLALIGVSFFELFFDGPAHVVCVTPWGKNVIMVSETPSLIGFEV
jgi:hypothetical protein